MTNLSTLITLYSFSRTSTPQQVLSSYEKNTTITRHIFPIDKRLFDLQRYFFSIVLVSFDFFFHLTLCAFLFNASKKLPELYFEIKRPVIWTVMLIALFPGFSHRWQTWEKNNQTSTDKANYGHKNDCIFTRCLTYRPNRFPNFFDFNPVFVKRRIEIKIKFQKVQSKSAHTIVFLQYSTILYNHLSFIYSTALTSSSRL